MIEPTWQAGDCSLYLGDCLEILPQLEAGSVDVVITSPPYNKTGFREGEKGHANLFKADIDYLSYIDNIPEKDYWEWQRRIFTEIYRLLKQTGSLFYNHQVRRNNGRAHHPIVELTDIDLIFYQQIIWDRCGSFNNNLTYLDICTELILWFVKNKPYVDKKIKYRTEIWRIPPSDGNSHPASFPVALPKNCILLSTKENDTVLDPFMGSGSTGLAAYKSGRKFIGVEIDKTFFDIAVKRIQQAQLQIRMEI